jgi:DNA-binding NarL/FixJ family response regulator
MRERVSLGGSDRRRVMVGVLVVYDNPVVRAALRGVLQTTGDIHVVAEAADSQEALATVRRLLPTVILLGHRMPAPEILSAVEALAERAAVLVLTDDANPELITLTLRSGARGYLVQRQFDPTELVHAVLAVADGEGWLSPVAASVAVAALRETVVRERTEYARAEQVRRERAGYGLTPREEHVLYLLCRGLPNAAIARRLTLTEKTVKNHLNHIFAKLRVTSRTEAVVRWTDRR